MDKYYGRQPQAKRHPSGPAPAAVPLAAGGPGAVARGDAASSTNPFDDRGASDGGSGARGLHTTNVYQQAASMNNAGRYTSSGADDFSFSNVNLSSPGHNQGKSPGGTCPTTPSGLNRASGSNRGIKRMGATAMKWLGITSPAEKEDCLPPNTNLAPASAEWYPNSPKVTFENDFPLDRSARKGGLWNNASPTRKVGLGVLWVALACALLGVTISEVRKAGARSHGAEGGSHLMGVPLPRAPEAPAPTEPPTAGPTAGPTTSAPTTGRPTRAPATSAPIDGFHAVHGKASDGTARPTRTPTTPRPSDAPSPGPTAGPTAAPSRGPPTRAPARDCADRPGSHANHLANPKDCGWLGNGKGGFTDRKDKNCGGRLVADGTGGTVVYPTTELGGKCRNACGLYNGCSTGGVHQAIQEEHSAADMSPMNGAAYANCHNRDGFHKNHLDNPKTCLWLDNDKGGYTDRKDKNCGGRPVKDENGRLVSYPTTELGSKCRQSCGLYNGCAAEEVTLQKVQEVNALPRMKRAANTRDQNMCEDRRGSFLNHLLNAKTCEWLHNGKTGYTDRKDKNCGGRPVEDENGSMAIYPGTELGDNCRLACGLYNGCTTEAVTSQEIREVNTLLGRKRTADVGNQDVCKDRRGSFLNHLLNMKTCEWLYNGKPGRSDRKDKNCGGDGTTHPATKLGLACAETCAPYRPCSGELAGGRSSAVNGHHTIRGYSSPMYSYSLATPLSSTACIDGEGKYVDHKRMEKSCSWLSGDDDNRYAAHRQEKNCGSASHRITELGRECPWSCRNYNDCGS